MKEAGIVIGLISLIALAVVGVLLHTSLSARIDTRTDPMQSDISNIKDSLVKIDERLASIEGNSGTKTFDSELGMLKSDISELKSRLSQLEGGEVASASDDPDSPESSDPRARMRGGIGEALEAFGESDENLTEEERKELEEKRSKAVQNIFRGMAKEGIKFAKKQSERRIARAVEKLGLSVGQEEQMKVITEGAIARAQELIDKMFEGEDVSEEWQQLRTDTDAQMEEVLTEEQFKEWKKSDPWRGPGMGRGMWGGRRRNSSGSPDGGNR